MLFLIFFLLVGIKDSTQENQKETIVRRAGGIKESIHYQSKDLSRESNKNFVAKNMSPPLTNFQTNTSSTTTSSSPSSIAMSNQSNMSLPHQAHMPHMYPQMYSSGTVPLIQHYPIHAGFMTNAPPGQPMIPPYGGQHSDRNDSSSRDSMGMQSDHQSMNSSPHQMNSTRGSRGRGRSRGGNNNMSRRDYQMRQHQHQHQQNQQSSVTSNDYGQPLLEQTQPTVMSSGPYPQFYIHHYPPYYASGPNAGGPHLAATATTAQNLTGQPLFALQQPVQLFQYGSPYQIMYNMMPTQAHPMSHQQSEITDSEHNHNPDSGGAAPTTVIQSIAWQHPVAYQEPHQQAIFQHSPHISAGESDLEFTHPDEYHMQIINPNNFNMIVPEQIEDNLSEQEQQDGYIGADSIENDMLDEHVYHHDSNAHICENEADLLVEKTRDLMIQTNIPPPSSKLHSMVILNKCEGENDETLNDAIVPIQQNSTASACAATESFHSSVGPKIVCSIDNKMIVRNKEKPPAWSSVVVPNIAAQASMKKQTASVSVSAIPNKDVVLLQSDLTFTSNDRTTNFHDAKTATIPIESTVIPIQTSFSSVIASKQSKLSPVVVDDQKFEPSHIDSQPQQKHQQALIDHAKQQIVTTITGIGATSQEAASQIDNIRVIQTRMSLDTENVVAEKNVKSNKPQQSSNHSAQPLATWAGLFNSSEASSVPKLSPQPIVLSTTSQVQEIFTETQKAPTAKNPEPQLVQAIQVPGIMSYSAVSAQSLPAPVNYAATVTSIPSQLNTTSGVLDNKKLPQSKVNLTNVNNNNNHLKSAPLVDQHALRLGGQ